MIINLNTPNEHSIEASKPIQRIRDYSNLAEALYHAEIGEVVFIIDAKTGKRERVERTANGWIYEVLH